ncbi:hypothetical protein R1sor_021915 [Riccia sorocarpa]|uniref:Uncharacterized protein n=1 Tax=Riccia sorocarpa TaxID=122646 RepID=A0ABD3GKJ7_9MARC
MISRDYEAVVAYIEEPENFRQVMGCGKKTKVGGKCISKAKAFHIMTSHLKTLRSMSLEGEHVYVNLVDVDYGSDDDVIPEENEPSIDLMEDETLEGRGEEEKNNDTDDTSAQRMHDHQ